MRNAYDSELYPFGIDIDGLDDNGNSYDRRPVPYTTEYTVYPYKFRSVEDLVTSDVFQDQLLKALAFKDATIRQLQQELLNS